MYLLTRWQRKLDNLQINTNKRVQKEEGIHRNEEGELVDKVSTKNTYF